MVFELQNQPVDYLKYLMLTCIVQGRFSIADLDDSHDAGAFSEPDYKARREALMAEVVHLTRSLGSDED